MPINEEKLKSSAGQGFVPQSKKITDGNQESQQEAESQLPALTRVMQQHAISRTQSDVAAVEKLAQLRTDTVLKAFDYYMSESDESIIREVGAKIRNRNFDFFAPQPLDGDVIDLEAQFQKILPASKSAIDTQALPQA